MIITHATDIGCVRTTNEDSYLCIEPHIYAVADAWEDMQLERLPVA